MPNELAEHAGSLYVTDSSNGCIWRGSTSRPTVPRDPWFQSELLTPLAGTMGANGITFGKGAAYVSSYDRGLILRIPVGRVGRPGAASVVADDPLLVGADGIRFDRGGRLWVAVSGTYDDSDWPLETIVLRRSWWWVPTVRSRQLRHPMNPWTTPPPSHSVARGRSIVLNGSYFDGTPSLVAFTR